MFQVSHGEGITFLGSKTDNKFYTIPGIDYISHHDVLPYEHSESTRDPIQHNLFTKFFEKKTDASKYVCLFVCFLVCLFYHLYICLYVLLYVLFLFVLKISYQLWLIKLKHHLFFITPSTYQ